jgi:hypothetical protein
MDILGPQGRYRLRFQLDDSTVQFLKDHGDTGHFSELTEYMLNIEAEYSHHATYPGPYWFSIHSGALTITLKPNRGTCTVENNTVVARLRTESLRKALHETLTELARMATSTSSSTS